MFKKLLLFLLPVMLNASRLCERDECEARYSRIVAGGISEPHTRPFQVALYMRVGAAGDLGFCGGSLVHQEWVITAAHCCYHNGLEVDHVQAILGAHSLYDRYENGRRIVNVAEIVVHPGYDPESFANDLALLNLANVIQLTDTINTIRLPYLSTASDNFAGRGATASGWGIAANGVTFVSPTLRERVLSVLTDSLCNSYYFNELPANTVCANTPQAGTCKGDNGGPLTITMNTTVDEAEIILIGVATFVSADGCNEELPSVFTRTQRYLPWISELTGIVLD